MEAPRLPETPTRDAPRGILGHHPLLEEEIFAFQRRAYPERRADWIAPRWRWMFLASAARVGAAPMVWLYRNAAGVVAHQGAIAVKAKLGERVLVTGWFVETMALEAVRGKAIGPMLVQKAKEDLPFNLSLGQTAPMRAIQLKMGWQQVAPLGNFVLPLRPERILRRKLPNPLLRGLAAAAVRGLLGTRAALRRRLAWEPRVTEAARFGPEHDRLWSAVRSGYRCAVERDASYLDWKYVEQPGQSFVRLEVRREAELAALAVLLVREPAGDYAYRRGFITELIADRADPHAVRAGLEAARRAACEREVDLLAFPLIEERLAEEVKAFGFIRRPPERFFLIATGGLSAREAELARAPGSWLVTMGDSDIDRPW
jgi:hypothetical protein